MLLLVSMLCRWLAWQHTLCLTFGGLADLPCLLCLPRLLCLLRACRRAAGLTDWAVSGHSAVLLCCPGRAAFVHRVSSGELGAERQRSYLAAA